MDLYTLFIIGVAILVIVVVVSLFAGGESSDVQRISHDIHSTQQSARQAMDEASDEFLRQVRDRTRR